MKSSLFQPDVLAQMREGLSQLNTLRNYENQSYQEYQFHNLEHHARDLITALISLSKKSKDTNLFDNIIQNINRFSTCLLTYSNQIAQLLPSYSFITVSHKHYASQGALLALFLRNQIGRGVTFVVGEKGKKASERLLAEDKIDDKTTYVQNGLKDGGVKVVDIFSWGDKLEIQKNQPIILDIFGLNPTDYIPFLVKNYQQIRINSHVFIYHSQWQDEEVTGLLQKLEENRDLTIFPLSISPEHPVQVIYQKDEKKMESALIDFLKEDLNHPEKQDIIIFFPLNLHIKRYISKLQEALAKNFLKDYVNIVTRPNDSVSKSKNNLFVVQGTDQLDKWNYDYSNVLYVLDFGVEAKFRFSYRYGCYVRSMGQCSVSQSVRRASRVGVDRIGRYSCKLHGFANKEHYADDIEQLSSYILRMVDGGLGGMIDTTNQRSVECLNLLQKMQIIKKQGQVWVVSDGQVLEAAKKGVSPIHSKIILNVLRNESLDKQKVKLANLMIMTLVVIRSEGNLRQSKQQLQAAAHIKPNGIWRKSGYLESALEILTKCDLIDSRQNQKDSQSGDFRRKTSKFNENQFDVFGSLFQIIQPKKKTFQEMNIPTLVRHFTVNQDLLYQFRQQIDNLREIFQVEPTDIIIEKEDILNTIRIILQANPHPVATYSGSRRVGYNIINDNITIFPDKTSLISQLNQRPDYLFILRLSENEGRRQILMSNSFNQQIYMQLFGGLPAKRSESLIQIELQFHGISSSTFQQLWKNNGIEVVKFQAQFQCYVEPNQEMALIVIHCSKDKSTQIRQSFEAILKRIRDKLAISSKIVHYLGNTNIVLGSGGAAKQITRSDYINRCILGNLHLEVTKQDLEELFEQFFILKEIQVLDPQPGKFSKSAIIQFNSQRDYYRFKQFYHECTYLDRLLDVKPLKGEAVKGMAARQYIQFKWYVWKSHNKALIKFAKSEDTTKAFQAFKENPTLDDVKVNVELTDKFALTISGLASTTDQIYIQEALRGYGEIKEVQILKTPLKEMVGEDSYLQNLIKLAIQNQNNQNALNFKLGPIQKKKNGLRVCQVAIADNNIMNVISNQLNKTIGKLGQGRLYAQTWFQIPILVPPGSMSIYQMLYEQTLNETPQKPNVQTYIQDLGNKRIYIILKGCIQQTVNFLHQRFVNKLKGYPIWLSEYERSIILTDIGLANLLDLEEKYQCKFIVDGQNKLLNVLLKQQYLTEIKQEIKSRVGQHFFYRISLNTKSYKFFKNQPKKIEQIKHNYALSLVCLENDTKALLLEGSALNVQKAFNYLMHFIESLTVPEEEMINADVCGICCEEPHRPYRLQNCSHKFCLDCLLQAINSSLGDMSTFPLKCPHCSSQIVIDDLDAIIEPGQWQKVINMAANLYLARHAEVMTFCYTAGCKQINMVQTQHFSCDVCLTSYCLACKMRYHPGLTCEQAKVGGDELFKKYMKENGIRVCPNKTCKVPLVRTDGCYRVTCTRCNKSMCFKCEPQKMIAYDDYNQCYAHLNQVHGGYW